MLIVGVSSCFLTSKLMSFTSLNSYHSEWLDHFFSYYTVMGDGTMCILVIIALFILKRKKLALILLVAYLSSGIFVQIIKRIINNPRPSLYFDQISFKYLYFVEGIHKMHSGSFPSGHTTSAFAMTIVLVLYFKQKWISFFVIGYFSGVFQNIFGAALFRGYNGWSTDRYHIWISKLSFDLAIYQ